MFKHRLRLVVCLLLLDLTTSFGISISEVPHLIALVKGTQLVCDGSLVSSYFVVSSAHPLYRRQAREIRAVGGTSQLFDKNSVYSEVLSIHISPKFNNISYNMDVSVLRLATPMAGVNVFPIAISTEPLTGDAVLQVSGWGKYPREVNYAIFSLNEYVITRDQCGKDLPNSAFCAVGHDACADSSGAAVVQNGRQVGIVSKGLNCYHADAPAVHTTSIYVKGFIDSVIYAK